MKKLFDWLPWRRRAREQEQIRAALEALTKLAVGLAERVEKLEQHFRR